MTKSQSVEEKISELVVQTMQEMAFIDIVNTEKNDLNFSSSIVTRLEILMPYSGDLLIAFDEELAKEFAVNVFGQEQYEQLASPVTDAASEFLNVIIGKIIGVLCPDLLFELGLPQVISPSSKIDLAPYIVQHYVTPEGRSINFYFRLERLITVLGI